MTHPAPRHGQDGAGRQVGVVDHGVVPDAGQDCECRPGHPLAGDLVARRDRNDRVVLRPCDGDRAWQGIQRCYASQVSGQIAAHTPDWLMLPQQIHV